MIYDNRKDELLGILQEEASEVVKAVSKLFKSDNHQMTQVEIGNFLGVLKLLIEEGHFNPEEFEKAGDAKIKKLEKSMKNKKVYNEITK